eukprot:2273288-Rhodomonas_salina.5
MIPQAASLSGHSHSAGGLIQSEPPDEWLRALALSQAQARRGLGLTQRSTRQPGPDMALVRRIRSESNPECRVHRTCQ